MGGIEPLVKPISHVWEQGLGTRSSDWLLLGFLMWLERLDDSIDEGRWSSHLPTIGEYHHL